MAIIRQVLQNEVSKKWAYVEYSDEDENIFQILGDKEFEDKLETNEWAKGFAIDSYKWKKPEIVEQTIGEKRMNVQFIKGNNDNLQNQKEAFAHMYNRLEKIKSKTEDEQKLISIRLAQESLEESMLRVEQALKFDI